MTALDPTLTHQQPTGLVTDPDASPSLSAAAAARAPFFFPPLWLGRRTAVLDQLRKHGVRSVCELGCGPGGVLAQLVQPADKLDNFPSIYPPSPIAESPITKPDALSFTPSASSSSALPSPPTRASKLDKLRRVERAPPTTNELHIERLVGLDVDRTALERAAKVIKPRESASAGGGGGGGYGDEFRWQSLRAELWLGSLETYNSQFEGIEAFVATEVIEHLTERAFDKFADIVCGYRPRLIVVTTPNHEFNPYFVSSSKEEESQNRFLDPTGRTKRVFRDETHTFEFTRKEFESWARSIARQNDYSVEFSGIGNLAGYYSGREIAFPPPSLEAHPELRDHPSSLAVPEEPGKFCATQIAVFVRQDSYEAERSPRSRVQMPLPFSPPLQADEEEEEDTNPARPRMPTRKSTMNLPHQQLNSFTHPAHSSANQPIEGAELLSRLARLFSSREGPLLTKRAEATGGGGKITLQDLWRVSEVRLMCGGVMGALVEAVVESEEESWDFELEEGKVGELGLSVVWYDWKEVEDERDWSDVEEEDEEEEEEEVEVDGYSDEESDEPWSVPQRMVDVKGDGGGCGW